MQENYRLLNCYRHSNTAACPARQLKCFYLHIANGKADAEYPEQAQRHRRQMLLPEEMGALEGSESIRQIEYERVINNYQQLWIFTLKSVLSSTILDNTLIVRCCRWYLTASTGTPPPLEQYTGCRYAGIAGRIGSADCRCRTMFTGYEGVDHQFQKFWIVIKINPEFLNLQTLPDLREN